MASGWMPVKVRGPYLRGYVVPVGGNMELRGLRREGVRETVVMVVAVIAAFAAGATALMALQGEAYESTALVTGPASPDDARSEAVARAALDAAGAREEPAAALLDHSSAEADGDGVSLTVRADSAAAARSLARAYSRALARRSGGRAEPASPARRTDRLLRAAITGAAIGLLAALLLALAREALDVRRTSSRTMAARLGTRELGHVPGVPAALEDSFLLVTRDHLGTGTAAYDVVAGSLAEEAAQSSARVLLVAGVVPEDHGEQVAANLSVALAALGHTVAIVEPSPARPMLRRFFALEREPGLTEVLRGEVALEDALTAVPGVENLAVITAGAADGAIEHSPDPILPALAESFDFVLVCVPPLLRRGRRPLPRADALVLAVYLHQVRRSRRPRLERLLRGVGMPTLGFVLVDARGWLERSANRPRDHARGEARRNEADRHQQKEQRAVRGGP